MPIKNGFSLLELLITLALIAIISTLTFPNFKNFSQQSQTKAQGERLMHALHLARSEAMLRGVTVTVCQSSNHTTCSDNPEAAQIIFINTQNNAAVSDKDDLLYVLDSPKHKGILYWRSSLHRNYLSFKPDGFTNGEDGTFWYCQNRKPNASWAVIVNQVGRARYVEDTQSLVSYTCS